MAEVLFFTHRGIRCGVPSKHVVLAGHAVREETGTALWTGHPDAGEGSGTRALFLNTSGGQRWVQGSDVLVGALSADEVQELPPFVRRLSALTHVVGLAIVREEVVWLVDPLRFHAPESISAPVAAEQGSLSSGAA